MIDKLLRAIIKHGGDYGMWTKAFWKDAAERVISTAAQAALAIFTVDGVGLADVDYGGAASIVGAAALASLLKAIIAGSAKADTISPASLVK